MSQVYLRKYSELLTTAKAVTFSLFEVDGIDLRVDATFATGDVTISKDGGAEANTTNLPVDEGKGYSLVLTLAELTCSQARISIIDQTGTKVWLDIELVVETYGNASAMHAFDLDTASVAQTADNDTKLTTLTGRIIGTLATGTHNPATVAQLNTLTDWINGGRLDLLVDAILDDTNELQSNQGNWLTATGFNTVVPPSVAQFNARTLLASAYFDFSTDSVTVGTNNDKTGYTLTQTFPTNFSDLSIAATTGLVDITQTAADKSWSTTVRDLTVKTGFSLAATGLDAIVSTATGMVEIAKAIWDRLLTGGTHNITNSAGKRLRATSGAILTDGTAQAGGTNSLQLASGDITINDEYVRAKVLIVGGTGLGQEAIITNSVASTDTISITPAWLVTPDNTSDYQLLPAQVHSTVRNGGYDGGYIYLDGTNGTAGIVKGVNGTTTLAALNIAEARTIANNENIRKFKIQGGAVITLAQSYADWLFDVVHPVNLALGGQDVSGSVFMRTGISGIGTMSTRAVFELCGLASATVGICNMLQCGFTGTTTLSDEVNYLAWNCFENDANTPIINMAGDGITATTLELIGYSGRIEIQNMTATDSLVITGNAYLTLNVNCTGGTATTAGDIKLTDNSGSVTITEANISDILTDTATTIPAQITALNNVSAAQVNAECDTAISDASLATSSEIATLTGVVDDLAIKKNTALSNFEFLMVLTSDHATPGTGLTVTGQRSIDGGAFAAVGGTIAEISNGIYQFDALAADTNGDLITWRFSEGTADDTFVTFKTVQ